MARIMRPWLAVVSVGCALLAVWRLPPSPELRATSDAPSPEEIALRRVTDELRDTYLAVSRTRWADSLARLALDAPEPGPVLLVPERLEGEAPEEVSRMRAAVRAEVAAWDAHAPDVVLARAYQPWGHGFEPTLLRIDRSREETYVVRRDGRTACLTVSTAPPGELVALVGNDVEDVGWRRQTGTLLGPCRFYGSYGLPGSTIEEWLVSGGADFAVGAQRDEVEEPLLWLLGGRRVPFGLYLGVLGPGRALEVDRCWSGAGDACAELVLYPSPGGLAPPPAGSDEITLLSMGAWLRPSAFVDQGIFLLADLERGFGHAAFERFWTSTRDVRPAFEEAFGVPLDEWLLSWVDGRLGITPPGPRLGRSAGLGSILLLGLLAHLAAFVQWRRRIA